ncbi:MAG: HNH endonuclease [Myxococcales bacterium]|nr:HNH endonuclease [Myxococcales bacterium]
MDRVCYLCQELPPDGDWSLEHIIPNALGGRWKSRSLLCRVCNSTTGSEIDAALCREVGWPMNMMGLTRERKPVPKQVVTLPDGSEYLRDAQGRLWPRHAIGYEQLDGNQVTLSIQARNRREARAKLREYEKKYPGKIDVEQFMSSLTETVQPHRSPVNFTSSGVGSSAALRAVAKIAANAFIEWGGLPDQIMECISFIRGESSRQLVRWYYVDEVWPDRGDMDVTHVVALRAGAPGEGLWGYVELFRIYRFAVQLSAAHKGPIVHRDYVYDIGQKRVVTDAQPVFSPGALDLEDGGVDLEAIRAVGSHMMRIAEWRSLEASFGEAIGKAFTEAVAANPNATTEDLLRHLHTYLDPVLLAVIQAGVRRDGSR